MPGARASETTANELLKRKAGTCRTLLFSGDYFLGGVLAAALTKLNLRSREQQGLSHKFSVECMLIVACILKLGKESQAVHPIDADSGDLADPCRLFAGWEDVALRS